ncbi:MFS transporter [Microbacterium chocolatum]|uniref:MFS transporter n=1 Tax=Microbacterium aurantiacum TaxID=162393 RepID=UPI00338D8723
MRDDAKDPDGERMPSPAPREILRLPAFAFFWSATTLRAFGGAIAGVAFQILIVSVLDATPAQISVLSALSVAPYLVLGFLVGALMDRWRRQRTLVMTSIGRALALAAVPVLLLTDTLTFGTLACVILALGVLTLFADSAAQPLLPRIVPRRSLVQANARLGQSGTVATTAGPALGGALFTALGAPVLFVLEALINTVAAILQSRIRVVEPPVPPRPAGRNVGHDIADGMRFTYRHPTLRPLAVSVHVWFLGNSIVMTVFAVYVLRELALPAWAFGVALAATGVGGFAGALIAPALGARWGAGRAILFGRALVVVPWLVLGIAPLNSDTSVVLTLSVVAASQLLYGGAMGIEDANDISYRQAVAPDAIQGRMNATIRTVNRAVFFVGALAAGALMTILGFAQTLMVGAVVFAVAAAVIIVSPLRTARHDDDDEG